MAIDGDRLVIGANHDNTDAGTKAGSAYVFARSGGTWSPDGHIYAGAAIADERFGLLAGEYRGVVGLGIIQVTARAAPRARVIRTAA